jgi:hypothetical protein
MGERHGLLSCYVRTEVEEDLFATAGISENGGFPDLLWFSIKHNHVSRPSKILDHRLFHILVGHDGGVLHAVWGNNEGFHRRLSNWNAGGWDLSYLCAQANMDTVEFVRL